MSKISIAGLQLALPYGDNRDALEKEVASTMLRFPWVDMIVCAELAAFGPEMRFAEELPGETERRFQALANRLGIWLLPGSLYERHDGLIYNTAPVINPQGEVVARYRKMYPFRPYEAGVASGQETVVFDVPRVGRFGVSICYDGWFPETTRAMVWDGAEVILHPTMTGTIDRDEELVIARANAIMNQCYFIDINNAGRLGNGRSIVVGPQGEVLHQAGQNNEIIPLTLDLDLVRDTRKNGLKGLGQPLKSFRDTRINFACYDPAAAPSSYLQGLGPLALPARRI
ncbi:MAG: carbon-nitrogen hydrolase family protein [Burkholderiaceae bacterium]|nr:carbon-nitrogen hydrolase family protein [Burkholderiaceae bacterium]